MSHIHTINSQFPCFVLAFYILFTCFSLVLFRFYRVFSSSIWFCRYTSYFYVFYNGTTTPFNRKPTSKLAWCFYLAITRFRLLLLALSSLLLALSRSFARSFWRVISLEVGTLNLTMLFSFLSPLWSSESWMLWSKYIIGHSLYLVLRFIVRWGQETLIIQELWRTNEFPKITSRLISLLRFQSKNGHSHQRCDE